MPNVHDAMEDKLAVLYGTASLGDGYAAWVAEHGPEWEDLLTYTESQTGTPGWDGFCLYWDLPATSPFSPADIAGLKMWLAADNLSLSDGDRVATWADASGQGNDFTQGTAGNRPTYKTGIIGGKPVVRHAEGAAEFMQTAFNGSGPNMTVIVFRINDAGSYALFGGDQYLYGDDLSLHRMFGGGGQLDGPAVVEDTPYITIARWAGAASKMNRSDTATTSTGTVTGGWSSGMTLGSNGGRQGSDIAEFLYYDSSLSDADVESLGNYLADKYGLTWLA